MGRTIVITGGTSGLGLGLKNMFEKMGDTVITFSNQEYNSTTHFTGDVCHEIKVRQVFNDIHQRYGKIDMLINCAGCGMSGITELAPLQDIQKVMDVNFYGTLYCTRSALEYMEEGSRIVNFSSAAALFPVPFRSIYAAAKSAVLNLSFALRMELEPYGIDVVAVCPGDTKTNFTANRLKDYATNERYGDRLQRATEHIDSKENKRMSAEYVCKQIFNLINKPKTKPFYIVGNKYKVLYFLTRFTPKSLLLKNINKSRGGLNVTEIKKVKETKQKITQEETSPEVQPNTSSLTKEELYKLESVNAEISNETTLEKQDVNTETTVTENTQEQNKHTEKTIDRETAKSNINNILSKITILNKPSEQTEDNKPEDVRRVPIQTNANNKINLDR